jgi:hypothetical protein
MAALVDYRITTAGDRKFAHNGVQAHAGRLVALDPNKAETVAALSRGLITATLTSSTHDVKAGDNPGTKSSEGLTTYTVQAAGANRILHNQGAASRPTPLASGATLQLDSLDDPAITFLAKGWIA